MNPALIFFLVGIGTGIFGARWKPFAFLYPKPPTEQLTAAQAAQAKAQADAAQARADAASAHAQERQKLESQVQWSQQMASGAENALSRVPDASKTPETTLAHDLILRANLGLAAAIGKLPADQQAEILQIVEEALSSLQAERDAAQAALAKKDAELAQVTKDRTAIQAKIPVLEQQVQATARAEAQAQATVTAKTNEVKDWAAKKAASDARAGSLSGALDSLWHYVLWIAGAWAFLAFVLPGIIKHLADSPIKRGLRHLSGYVTSPLLYQDARTKLTALQKTNNPNAAAPASQ